MLVRDLAKIRPRLAYYFGVGLEEYHSDIEPLVAEFLGKLRKKVVGKRNLQFASQKIEPQSTIEKLVFKDLEKIRTRSTEYLGVQMADYIRMFEPTVIRFLRKLKREFERSGKEVDKKREDANKAANNVVNGMIIGSLADNISDLYL